jgi:hypothetical protein
MLCGVTDTPAVKTRTVDQHRPLTIDSLASDQWQESPPEQGQRRSYQRKGPQPDKAQLWEPKHQSVDDCSESLMMTTRRRRRPRPWSASHVSARRWFQERVEWPLKIRPLRTPPSSRHARTRRKQRRRLAVPGKEFSQRHTGAPIYK